MKTVIPRIVALAGVLAISACALPASGTAPGQPGTTQRTSDVQGGGGGGMGGGGMGGGGGGY